MSGSSQPVYYWDACIYLAWLLNEQSHGKDCIDAMTQIASDNFQLKNTLFTSVITRIEVLESKLTQDQAALFKKALRSSNHIQYDVDPPIADKAHEFRQRVLAEMGKPLSVPDAIHIATAQIYGAHQLHTFDDGQKNKKLCGLLDLSGRTCIDGLKICKPVVPQGLLTFSPPAAAITSQTPPTP
ncbi:MAG TPA: PIN domain-containing protein [Verrucomicrobiae bacterium]|nr:PIN domain-containing protein [Verrucomicrobiae bacterium]